MPEPAENKVISIDQARMEKRPEAPISLESHKTQSTAVAAQQSFEKPFQEKAERKLRELEEKVDSVQREILGITKINFLPSKQLKKSIDIILERDGEGFIARTLEIALYGYADDALEAVSALKSEIESLYDELMEDDNFTKEWLNIKEFLRQRISDR